MTINQYHNLQKKNKYTQEIFAGGGVGKEITREEEGEEEDADSPPDGADLGLLHQILHRLHPLPPHRRLRRCRPSPPPAGGSDSPTNARFPPRGRTCRDAFPAPFLTQIN